MRRVLGCTVSRAVWQRWQTYLTPTVQPFFVSEQLVDALPDLPRWTRAEVQAMQLPLTLRDTLSLHAVNGAAPWVLMLDEEGFQRVPAPLRTSLLDEQLRAGRGGVQRVADWPGRLSPVVVRRLVQEADDGLFLWWPGRWNSLPAAARDPVLSAFLTEDHLPHRGDEVPDVQWTQVDA